MLRPYLSQVEHTNRTPKTAVADLELTADRARSWTRFVKTMGNLIIPLLMPASSWWREADSYARLRSHLCAGSCRSRCCGAIRRPAGALETIPVVNKPGRAGTHVCGTALPRGWSTHAKEHVRPIPQDRRKKTRQAITRRATPSGRGCPSVRDVRAVQAFLTGRTLVPPTTAAHLLVPR